MGHTLIYVASEADWHTYHAIRRAVLWEERGLDDYDEKRPEERLTHHHSLLLKLDGLGIGTTRLDDLRDGTGIIRLVAITATGRGQGHGRVLGAMVEEYARRLGINMLLVNAALNAEGFYLATGWTRRKTNTGERVHLSDRSVEMSKDILPLHENHPHTS